MILLGKNLTAIFGGGGGGGSSTFAGLSDKTTANIPVINTPLAVALTGKEAVANKKTDVDANKTSNVFFPTVKAVFDWVSSLFVKGAVSSTDNAIARFDGTTGKLLQDSNITIDDAGIAQFSGRIANAYINLQSEQFSDTGMIGGLFDRCVTTNAHIFGTLTATVENGMLTGGNNVVDGIVGTTAAITGVSAATTFTVVVDMLSNVDNYSRAKWLPFVAHRSTTFNFFRDYTVSVSTDGATWYTSAVWQKTGFSTTDPQFPYWFGSEHYPAPLTTWRYVKFVLSNPRSTSTIYVSQVGMRHVNAPYINRNVAVQRLSIANRIIDNVGSSGTDGQVLKKVGGLVLWSNP